MLLSSCTDDLNAPFNYDQTTTDATTGDGLMLDCAGLPQAAVAATFSATLAGHGRRGAGAVHQRQPAARLRSMRRPARCRAPRPRPATSAST
ncbi:MAG: hypothetical protein U0168_01165 [Nannocystaceae bacterium]